MDEQRKLLDQLMGQDRDLPLEERTGRKKKFSDPQFCKYYLCGVSPWDTFKNTRSSSDVYRVLGEYDKTCDDECKEQWEALTQQEKDEYGYEYDLMVLLEKLVQEANRKIERAKDRVARENTPRPFTDSEKKQVDVWVEELRALDEKADKAADEGEVDACEAAVKRSVMLKKYKENMEQAKYSDKVTSVCEVTGILLSSKDSEQRKLDHVNGKQYQGWKSIREKLEELKRRNPPPAKGRRQANGRSERRRDGEAYRDRDRNWNRGRDYRRRDRDRDRDRDRGRDWDRDRGYQRRERRRSRSRERSYR
ncbi:Luc7-like protein [Chloropicon primus]|uniref:Luc7-like protein n=1 Tax=Chloropicon primus TaxID=1764295 RepID=A0A5B8MB89_9CHLO|nr:Luc7-like protein [Chloropicon primus]UPQ96935.1 Luc7-like protein [Chloropicon primus]|eukprot:QDZ17718.1 Luc7-like protein [Chloropicon primus]